MKAIFTFLLMIFFWLNATPNDLGSAKQKGNEPAKNKSAAASATSIVQTDSISGYIVNVNGGLNTVQITNEKPAGKSLEIERKQKNTSNSIEINGEGNSVNIKQNNNSGKVNINQNGNGNQINISQSIPNSEK